MNKQEETTTEFENKNIAKVIEMLNKINWITLDAEEQAQIIISMLTEEAKKKVYEWHDNRLEKPTTKLDKDYLCHIAFGSDGEMRHKFLVIKYDAYYLTWVMPHGESDEGIVTHWAELPDPFFYQADFNDYIHKNDCSNNENKPPEDVPEIPIDPPVEENPPVGGSC